MANYKSNPSNSFFAFEDDIDDEKFLKNSRNYSYTGQPNGNSFYSSPQGSFEDKKAQLLERKKAIENETLESTERSLYLLRESEETGIATAEELQRQREQLERADRNLDTINSALRTTQRKIDGIKSVFGSFKNYLTRKSDPLGGTSKPTTITPIDRQTYSNSNKSSEPSQSVHPGLKIRGLAEDPASSLSVSEKIDKNLDHMFGNISTLKNLALEMGNEIEYQNSLIEDITYKADKADITIKKQTKEMNRIIK
ncbi:hypothetical protein RUM43_011261 [Polyplax serrata]|uniref:t-SNARE coiled-coil homology domain-containing protein n=1 Tax=Polyplax serrata TaxID=468196 RepID=A0AAN8PEX9_POLSC